jgi:hypothetical protein
LKKFLTNGTKSIFALFYASLTFIAISCFFALIAALSVKGFPFGRSLLDNFYLFIILCVISIPLGFFLGSIAGKLKQKRIFFLSLLGLIAYWLLLVFIILIFSKTSASASIFPSTTRLAVQAMLAYSFYAVPVVMSIVFLLEKWTRKK